MVSEKLIIKNGIVVTDRATFKADVEIKDGKIIAIGENLTGSDELIDATGKYILPGAIESHAHLAMPFMGTTSADDYYDGTKAAACGGVTTVFDFAIQNTGEHLVDTIKRRDELCAPDACIDYSFHVAITDIDSSRISQMEEAVKFGVPSFKMFMTYDFSIDDGTLYLALKKSIDYGALIALHAENKEIINLLASEFVAEGNTSPWYHYLSRPEFVEAEAVTRAIQIAKSVGAPLNIVHLSSAEGLEAVKNARNEGYPIFTETCPQYLAFTKEVYKRPDASKFVCSPPMKGQESLESLWQGVLNNHISTVATDHCPFTLEQKEMGKDNFRNMPNGCSGIEVLYPYMLSQANKGKISFNRVVELCASNPAKLYGCEDRKGNIAPGMDADIVIYDPNKSFEISPESMHSNTDNTIWDGMTLEGYPVMTISRGRVVYNDGQFIDARGHGEFVKCNPLFHKVPSF